MCFQADWTSPVLMDFWRVRSVLVQSPVQLISAFGRGCCQDQQLSGDSGFVEVSWYLYWRSQCLTCLLYQIFSTSVLWWIKNADKCICFSKGMSMCDGTHGKYGEYSDGVLASASLTTDMCIHFWVTYQQIVVCSDICLNKPTAFGEHQHLRKSERR